MRTFSKIEVTEDIPAAGPTPAIPKGFYDLNTLDIDNSGASVTIIVPIEMRFMPSKMELLDDEEFTQRKDALERSKEEAEDPPGRQPPR